MIEFLNIHKRFGSKVVLNGITLRIDRGSVHFIIGSSGVGKSVLVKHLVGLVRPDEGQILLDGQDITHLKEADFYPIRQKCAMVFQHSTLFDSMTLAENVALPLRKHKKVNQSEALSRAREILSRVNMDGMADRYPTEIGHGLQKRVAIARALTLEPEFVIFDEPTTGLDPLAAANVDELITNLSDEQGVTCVVVSHDLRSIFGVADRISMLYLGGILLDGTPSDFESSDNPVVSQFISGRADGPMEL